MKTIGPLPFRYRYQGERRKALRRREDVRDDMKRHNPLAGGLLADGHGIKAAESIAKAQSSAISGDQIIAFGAYAIADAMMKERDRMKPPEHPQ